MTVIKSKLNNYRQSPRKVRLVADFVKGKKVTDVLDELVFLPKKASGEIKKMIESGVANAKENYSLEKDSLYVKSLRVDQGYVMMRFRQRSRGSSAPIRKKTSKLTLELTDEAPVKKGKKKSLKPLKKEVNK